MRWFSMAEKNKVDEFEVLAGETTAAFDLDYSQKEIQDTQKLYEEDDHFINRTTLRALVTEHPFFAKFFHWLRFSTPYKPEEPQQLDESGKKIRRETKGNAIPVELLSFFKLYMMEVRSQKGKSMAIRKGKVPEGMEESFHQRLLEYARAEERKSDDCDSEIHWTRCLYQNENFQKNAVRNLWDEEYMLRAKGLYEKVKRLPPEQQLTIFQNIVPLLDDEITRASKLKTDNGDIGQTQESGLEVFLDEFPKQVISHCRQRKVSKFSGKRVTYTVEDLTLKFDTADNSSNDTVAYQEISSLEKAMRWIRGNTNGSLQVKKVARAAYLGRLNQNTSKSEFQRDYETVRAYVNACAVEFSPEVLQKEIASRAAAYYGSAFHGQMAMPGCYISDPNSNWWKSEMNRLIEEYVSRSYSSFYYQYKNYLEFINSSRGTQDDIIALIVSMAYSLSDNPKSLEDETGYQNSLAVYMKYLRDVMPCALEGNWNLGSLVNREQQQVLAKCIAELCMQSFQKLGIEAKEWADAEILKTAISRYNSVVFPSEGPKMPPGITQYDVFLRKALITIKVGEAFDECCRTTEQNILTLTAAIKEMKQKKP